MRLAPCAALALLLTSSLPCMAACAPIRIGYIDQHRPPYWLGSGKEIPEPPGASVELLRQFAASAGAACTARLSRVPVLRLKTELAAGELDFAPVDAGARDTPGIAFPRDQSGGIDASRAVSIAVVVFVRASDRIAGDTNPNEYFKGQLIGATFGSAYADTLRRGGVIVDDGAKDVARNFEKLRLHRIDGFAVSLIAANDMDADVKARYGHEFVRLEQPFSSGHIWLAANQAYYERHAEQVERMWKWLGGAAGKKVFTRLLEKYATQK